MAPALRACALLVASLAAAIRFEPAIEAPPPPPPSKLGGLGWEPWAPALSGLGVNCDPRTDRPRGTAADWGKDPASELGVDCDPWTPGRHWGSATDSENGKDGRSAGPAASSWSSLTMSDEDTDSYESSARSASQREGPPDGASPSASPGGMAKASSLPARRSWKPFYPKNFDSAYSPYAYHAAHAHGWYSQAVQEYYPYQGGGYSPAYGSDVPGMQMHGYTQAPADLAPYVATPTEQANSVLLKRLGNCLVCRVGASAVLRLYFFRKAKAPTLEYMIHYNPLRKAWMDLVSIPAGQGCPIGQEKMAESVRKSQAECLNGSRWFLKRHSVVGPWARER